MTRLDAKNAEVLVIASPHGPALGIYRRVSGDLGAFGLSVISVAAQTYDLWSEVAGSERVAIESPADHGVVVPLRLIAWDLPVIALATADSDAGRAGPAASAAGRAARLIQQIATTKNVAVVASVNTSAALSARAPYPNDANASESETRLLEILQTDMELLKNEAEAITEQGRSCALSPLLVLAELFGGRGMELLAHEAPVGVGYLVAQVT